MARDIMDSPRSLLLSTTVLLFTALRISEAQAPQLVQSLRTSYKINPASNPEFNECRFTGNPPPTIEWTYDGESLPTSEQGAQNGVYYFPTNGSLILRRASGSNSGMYECIGTNSFGTDRATTQLNITRPGTPWYVMWYMWFIYALLLWSLLIPVFIVLFFYRKKRAEKDLPPPDPWIGN